MMTRIAKRTCLLGMILLAAAPGPARAESAEEKFYQAYYLEQEQADYTSAAKLYEQVASDRRADDQLRDKARARLAVLAEEIASDDLASLMPPEALAYVEIRKPGEQLVKFIGELGLLGDPDRLPEAGAQKLAISPELIKAILGIRGLAAAVTSFNPMTQTPSGVAVFNPGNLELVRGLIRTGLPVAGQPLEPIHGYPAYNIEDEVIVALTNRLVIVSTERAQIEGVLTRLSGKEKRSLADSEALADLGPDRDDALLLFFVNAKPLVPMLTMGIAAGAGAQELAIAQAILDLGSLQSFTGKLAVGEDGIGLDVALRLDEGHKNLAFNFLRTPAIHKDTLKCLPAGAAAFGIGALNEAPSRFGNAPAGKGVRPPISVLDIGREFFANITSFAAFAMPPSGPGAEGGFPIPDAGLAITVNDPAKSEALWTQFLGIASLAAGTGAMEGNAVEIEGVNVRTYRVPDGPVIHFATVGNDVLIATSAHAIAASIKAKRDGQSVLDDKAFAKALTRINPATTRALFVHAGRAARMARQFIPPRDLEEIEPVLGLLDETAASVVMDHSDRLWRVSVAVSGIPDVSGLVDQVIAQQQEQQASRARVAKAIKAADWDDAISAIDAELNKNPDDPGLLRKKFDVLATRKKDRDAALRCGQTLAARLNDNARGLNNFAWALLTDERYGGEYTELAARMAERANELTDYANWMFLDTLAVARFENGEIDEAVKLEEKAIELCDGDGKEDLKRTLARFQEALARG